MHLRDGIDLSVSCPQQFGGFQGDFFHERRESTHLFFEPHFSEKLVIQLLPWGAGQPVRIFDSYRGETDWIILK